MYKMKTRFQIPYVVICLLSLSDPYFRLKFTAQSVENNESEYQVNRV